MKLARTLHITGITCPVCTEKMKLSVSDTNIYQIAWYCPTCKLSLDKETETFPIDCLHPKQLKYALGWTTTV